MINDTDKKELIFILKNKRQNKEIDRKKYFYSIMSPYFFFQLFYQHNRNVFYVFKINYSYILFHSSSIVFLSEPIFGWEVAFNLFSKTFHTA